MRKFKVFAINLRGNVVKFVKEFKGIEELERYMRTKNLIYLPCKHLFMKECVDVTDTNVTPYMEEFKCHRGRHN